MGEMGKEDVPPLLVEPRRDAAVTEIIRRHEGMQEDQGRGSGRLPGVEEEGASRVVLGMGCGERGVPGEDVAIAPPGGVILFGKGVVTPVLLPRAGGEVLFKTME
jgi:hypothetical protein